MRIRRMALAVALLAGCESSATAEAGNGAVLRSVRAITAQSAVVSARRVGPNLYAIRAQVSSGDVTLAVRVTSGSGFPTLTSGAEIIRFSVEKMAEVQVAMTAGNRYLVMAIPGQDDPALLDYSLAHFIEIVP